MDGTVYGWNCLWMELSMDGTIYRWDYLDGKNVWPSCIPPLGLVSVMMGGWGGSGRGRFLFL